MVHCAYCIDSREAKAPYLPKRTLSWLIDDRRPGYDNVRNTAFGGLYFGWWFTLYQYCSMLYTSFRQVGFCEVFKTIKNREKKEVGDISFMRYPKHRRKEHIFTKHSLFVIFKPKMYQSRALMKRKNISSRCCLPFLAIMLSSDDWIIFYAYVPHTVGIDRFPYHEYFSLESEQRPKWLGNHSAPIAKHQETCTYWID